MEHFTAALYHWLRSHDIDPKKVGVVIRANDNDTYYKINAAVKHSMNAMTYANVDLPPDLSGLQMNGVRLSFSNLDKK